MRTNTSKKQNISFPLAELIWAHKAGCGNAGRSHEDRPGQEVLSYDRFRACGENSQRGSTSIESYVGEGWYPSFGYARFGLNLIQLVESMQGIANVYQEKVNRLEASRADLILPCRNKSRQPSSRYVHIQLALVD